jgi:hypothetical protein
MIGRAYAIVELFPSYPRISPPMIPISYLLSLRMVTSCLSLVNSLLESSPSRVGGILMIHGTALQLVAIYWFRFGMLTRFAMLSAMSNLADWSTLTHIKLCIRLAINSTPRPSLHYDRSSKADAETISRTYVWTITLTKSSSRPTLRCLLQLPVQPIAIRPLLKPFIMSTHELDRFLGLHPNERIQQYTHPWKNVDTVSQGDTSPIRKALTDTIFL